MEIERFFLWYLIFGGDASGRGASGIPAARVAADFPRRYFSLK